jgi:RNA polymerase sigma factor (sigma-70 family)
MDAKLAERLTGPEQAELRATAARAHGLDAELARRLEWAPLPRAPDPGPYLRAVGARPVPDDPALVARAQAGDPRARAELVDACLPLVASVARAYRAAPGIERLELLQEGVAGLLRALERFDPALGTPFRAYAAWWVRQAMQQLVAELTRPVVLSDRALRRLSALRDAHRAHVAEHRREPSAAELAAATGLEPGQVEDLLAAERAPRSLDEPLGGSDGAVGVLGELLADPLADDAYERVVDHAAAAGLGALLGGLSDRERAVVAARHGLDGPERSLRELAAELGVSAERVRQVEGRALGKLRAAAGVDDVAGRPT